MIRFSLLLLLLASFTYGTIVPGDGVTALTQDNFTTELHSFRHVLVLFYEPEWLTGNPLITDYPQISKDVHQEFPGISVCQLDVTSNQAPADQYNVKELPTLMLISKMNGVSSSYNGDASSKDIRDWLKKEIGELIIPVTSVQQAQKFISHNKYVAFYLGSESSEDYASFIGWTTSHTDFFFMKSDSSVLKKVFGVNENGFVFSRDNGQEENILQAPLSIDNLNQWIKTYKYPTAMKIEALTTHTITYEQLDIVFLIKDNSSASAQSEKIFEEIAKEFRGKLAFGVVPAEKQHGINLMKSFGFKEKQLPAIALLHSKDNRRKYRLDREFTSKNLKIFLLNFFEGNLVNFCRSASIPGSPFDGAIKVVVGDIYKKTVLDESKDVLIEFYSPKCGHCKQFAPIYSALGEKLEHIEDLVIAKIDATANDVDSVELTGYPMLVFYPRNSKKSPITYQGGLSIPIIIDFIKNHGTVQIDI